MKVNNIVEVKLSRIEVQAAIAAYVNDKAEPSPGASATDVRLFDDGSAVVTAVTSGGNQS